MQPYRGIDVPGALLTRWIYTSCWCAHIEGRVCHSKEYKKRLEIRAEVTWPVIIDTISGPIYGQTKNISASGAFLVCRQPLYKGEVVRCIVKAPSRSLEMDAEVIWSDIYQPPDKDFPHNVIDIFFKRIPSDSRDFLALSVYDSLKSTTK